MLKLDFAKAFDTVNWEGLFAILKARGFEEIWIDWIRTILSSSKSAVLVNGCPGPWINCKRGLRQGDPLSPYLFLLVAETLQRMIQREFSAIPHPIESGTPCAVLQYADDTLILLKGAPSAVSHLKIILDQSAAATSLSINYNKSTAVPISGGAGDGPRLGPLSLPVLGQCSFDESVTSQCIEILGCRKEGFPQTYLGLPLSATKLPVSSFAPYICKTDRYLPSWQASLLNLPCSFGLVCLISHD